MHAVEWDLLLIALAAFLAALLTFFSGFGLGTLLMPVLALFVPVTLAVAITALVHLANNLFKLLLIGRRAEPRILWRFGLPAVLFAFIGAALLGSLATLEPLGHYTLWGHERTLHPLKLTIGLLILLFVILETTPAFSKLTLHPRHLPYGGALTGFFGGLSGHQGVFRSLFLLKAGLDKERFVATGVVLAVMVDLARLTVYGTDIVRAWDDIPVPLLTVATLSAFIGSYAGSRWLKKITLHTVQRLVSALLALVGIALIAGLI